MLQGGIVEFQNLDLSLNEFYCEWALVMARTLEVNLVLKKQTT